MNDASGHSCLLHFDTDDAEFGRGFEVGRIWALLRATDDAVIETMHIANAEMILRLAEATGREVCATELDDHWIEARFAEVDGGLEC